MEKRVAAMGVLEKVRVKNDVMKAPVELPIDQILMDDCIAAMRSLPDACIDMVFADPPYNLQLGGDLFRPEGGRVDAVDNDWDKFDSLATYTSPEGTIGNQHQIKSDY